MSQTDPLDPALAALLKADRAPPLPTGFADRVVAAAEVRGPALPPLRRAPASRWRGGRRVVLGLGAAALLSTAAAATGVLERVGITLPPPVQAVVDNVAQTVTGRSPPAQAVAPAQAPDPAPVVVTGPIDSPAELEAAFDQADAVRAERLAQRRAVTDQRIDQVLERRRAAGLPVPSAEREAAARQRLDQARTRRDERVETQRSAVRETLRETLDQGQPVTRDTVRQAVEQVREESGMPARQRLNPEQREALRRRLAERRRLTGDPAPVPESAPSATPEAENLP